MPVFIVRANTRFITLHTQLSSATCHSRCWSVSGRYYNNIRGKYYQGGGLPFTVDTLQHKVWTVFPYKGIMKHTRTIFVKLFKN
jgi:hypothetical protein